MNSRANSAESKDTIWVVVGVVIAVVLGVRWGVPKVHSWWGDGGEQLVSSWLWLVPVVGGLAIACLAGRWWRRRRARRRREVAAVLAARLEAVMPKSWRPSAHLQIRRWSKSVPAKVVVALPAECPTEDPQWRRAVIKAAREVMGVTQPVKWPALTGKGRRRIVLVAQTRDIPGQDSKSDPDAMGDMITTALAGIVPSPSVQVTGLGSADAEIVVGFSETTRDQSPQWRGRVIDQITARTDQRWRATWNRKTRQVVLHPVPELPAVIKWSETARAVQRMHPDLVLAPYGVDEQGRWVAWKIGDRQPHTVIVGETGSGKTEAMKSMMLSALAAGCLVAIIDPKLGKDFAEFLGKPGVVALAGSIEDAAAALLDLQAEMKRRLAAAAYAELIRQNPALAMPLPEEAAIDVVPLLMFVDETTQLVDDLTKWWASLSKDEKSEWGSDARQAPMLTIPAQFAQLARAIRMHLVAGMQRGDAKNFGDSTQMRDNLQHKVSMAALSPIGSEMVWADRNIGSRVDIASVGEGMSNGTRILPDGTLEESRAPTRFKAMFTAATGKDPEFWQSIKEISPDASLIKLPRVSDAAKDPAAAAAALFYRAYGTHPPQGSDTASITRDLDKAEPLPTSGPIVSEPAADVVEIDDAGTAWSLSRATELVEGDTVTVGDLDSVVVADVEGWMVDEFSGDDVFRVTVVGVDGEQVIDLGDEEMVYRAGSAPVPV